MFVALRMKYTAETECHPHHAQEAGTQNKAVLLINQSIVVVAAGKLLQIWSTFIGAQDWETVACFKWQTAPLIFCSA